MHRQIMIAHWYYMLWATARLLLTFGRARWYFGRHALRDLALPHPEALTSTERRRLQHYFYGGTYLHTMMCALQGRTRTRREKWCLTNLAALAYFFDDLVDEFRNRDDSGVLWQDNPEAYGQVADDERQLALHFLQNVYDWLPEGHLDAFRTTMHEVFNVETSGRQVSDNLLTINELSQVTKVKGGGSVLLFRMALTPMPSAAESAAWRAFGGLIQLSDDIFDLWFDHRDGIATLPTWYAHRQQIKALTAHYEQEVAAVRAALDTSGWPRHQVREARCVIHYVVSITRLCLGHYERLAAQTGGILPLEDRKALVVDMERWSNRFRAAWLLAGRVG
jgi:hypothetical protein